LQERLVRSGADLDRRAIESEGYLAHVLHLPGGGSTQANTARRAADRGWERAEEAVAGSRAQVHTGCHEHGGSAGPRSGADRHLPVGEPRRADVRARAPLEEPPARPVW